jgi:hypothetical protein
MILLSRLTCRYVSMHGAYLLGSGHSDAIDFAKLREISLHLRLVKPMGNMADVENTRSESIFLR